jgi:hypothetical protein
MRHISLLALAACSLLAGCGSSDDEGTERGDKLPNTPSATDPCGLNSGFDGDELCILPPAAGEGIQIHAGPASYDEATVAPWVIGPGEENVRCFMARIPESGFYYLKQENRMRSGSHHMIITLNADEGQEEGPADCEILGSIGGIPGSQTPKRDFPDQLAPEDDGLARYLPAGSMANFQLHYVNTGTTPLLREAWINLYRLDESAVKQRLNSVFLVADFATNIPPKTRQQITNVFEPTLPEPTRIFALNAHMHAHSETMTVWRIRGEERELLYKSFDWAEPDSLTYNTVVKNSPPDDAAKKDGGFSGLLHIEPGDKLEWTCDVNNTLDTAIHFANEAYTAEMCLLSGAYIGDTPGLFAGGCSGGQCAMRP